MDEGSVPTIPTRPTDNSGLPESGVPTNGPIIPTDGQSIPTGPVFPAAPTVTAPTAVPYTPAPISATDSGSPSPTSTVPSTDIQPAVQDNISGGGTPPVTTGEPQPSVTPGVPEPQDGSRVTQENAGRTPVTEGGSSITPQSSVSGTNPGLGEGATKKKRIFHRKAQVTQNVPPGSTGAPPKKNFFQRLRPAHYITGAVILMLAGTIGLTAHTVQAPSIGPTITPVASVSATMSPSLSPTNGPRKGLPSAYPNPALTTGAVLPVTTAQVCKSGYTATVRNVSQTTKNEVFAEYGITVHPTGSYEVDHYIPLELGGSNDISNLWPEPATPVPGFHQKDVTEDYLHKQVCSGQLTLGVAQAEIQNDWLAVYLTIPNRSVVTPTGL